MPRGTCLNSMRLALVLCVAAVPAFAQQPPEVQRALIERDQRTVEFAARVRGAPPAELQGLENLTARQLADVQRDQLPVLRPYERQKAARESEAFVLRLPPPVVRIEVPKELQPRIQEPLGPP